MLMRILTAVFTLGLNPAAYAFTYDDLVELIQSKHLFSVEEVLPRLPEELRSNYVLMHDSRGLQSASYSNPRAILFGHDAKLTLAFNGDPAQAGYDTLEAIQFRGPERSFDFRQIRFPTAQNKLSKVEFSPRNKTTDGRISCTGCHGGSDPRPNWNHYSVWPGAYGSDDDVLKSERAPYGKFVRVRAGHPRYRWLIQGNNPNDPYMDPSLNIDVTHRPNLRFSDMTGSLNSLRATRILENKLALWQKLAFAVSALHCELTEKQKNEIAKTGLNADHDMSLATIFSQVGLSNNQWGTQIFSDEPGNAKTPWEHQSGFTFLSQGVAMAIAQDLARKGNATLGAALDSIDPYLARTYSDDHLEFYRTLNGIVPFIDQFGVGFESNRKAVCPELAQVFVTEYLRPRSPKFNN